MENDEPRKGAIIKLFGVVLIFLGALDSMLSWRGGIAVSDFYVFLIASGVLLYAVGAIRRGSGSQRLRQTAPQERRTE